LTKQTVNKIDKALEEYEDSMTSSEVAATWNSAHENLLAAIADRSNCSRWMHSKSQDLYDRINFGLTIPSIIISTISGTATIGLPGLLTDSTSTRFVTVFVGVLTLTSGLLTSLNQYMKTSQLSESHRIASVSYGKLHRVISTELALRRDQRISALDFLKTIRSEQDRLHDTCPSIVDSVIAKFRKEFDSNLSLEKPEIAGDLNHVLINRTKRESNSSSASVQPSPAVNQQGQPNNLNLPIIEE
jgi:hypothetical protein